MVATAGTVAKTGAQVNVTVDYAVCNVVDAIAVLHLIGIQLWPIHVKFFKSKHNIMFITVSLTFPFLCSLFYSLSLNDAFQVWIDELLQYNVLIL